MVIFIVLSEISCWLVQTIISILLPSGRTIYNLLAVGVFISVPLMLMTKTRLVGVIILISILFCYIGYDVIKSYPIEVGQLLTILISVLATFLIKRKMWHWVREDTIRDANGGISYFKHSWIRWLIRLI